MPVGWLSGIKMIIWLCLHYSYEMPSVFPLNLLHAPLMPPSIVRMLRLNPIYAPLMLSIYPIDAPLMLAINPIDAPLMLSIYPIDAPLMLSTYPIDALYIPH